MSTPNTLKKYYLTTLLFAILLGVPLHAQEADKKSDLVDKEFLGPLSLIPELISVGDPGNPADSLTGLGAVQEPFQIGKYDVTILQWATFLNAVHVVEGDPNDPRHLYHKEMFQGDTPTSFLKTTSMLFKTAVDRIYRIDFEERKFSTFFPRGWEGTYDWALSMNRIRTKDPSAYYDASLPITGISFDDAKRYINWLDHGAPFFSELNEETLKITETGTYDFTNGKQGELMQGGRYFLPSLTQWYKAAYYKAGTSTGGYWLYPTQSNELPYQTSTCNLFDQLDHPKTGANYATISPAWSHFKWHYVEEMRGMPLTTPVGAFKDSPGPYGTYDMGGNVRQWTHDAILEEGFFSFNSHVMKKIYKPVAAGGSFEETSDALLSTGTLNAFDFSGGRTIGLRIAASMNVSDDFSLLLSRLATLLHY